MEEAGFMTVTAASHQVFSTQLSLTTPPPQRIWPHHTVFFSEPAQVMCWPLVYMFKCGLWLWTWMVISCWQVFPLMLPGTRYPAAKAHTHILYIHPLHTGCCISQITACGFCSIEKCLCLFKVSPPRHSSCLCETRNNTNLWTGHDGGLDVSPQHVNRSWTMWTQQFTMRCHCQSCCVLQHNTHTRTRSETLILSVLRKERSCCLTWEPTGLTTHRSAVFAQLSLQVWVIRVLNTLELSICDQVWIGPMISLPLWVEHRAIHHTLTFTSVRLRLWRVWIDCTSLNAPSDLFWWSLFSPRLEVRARYSKRQPSIKAQWWFLLFCSFLWVQFTGLGCLGR